MNSSNPLVVTEAGLIAQLRLQAPGGGGLEELRAGDGHVGEPDQRDGQPDDRVVGDEDDQVPALNANIALWIAVARTSGSSESSRLRILRSRPSSAVTGCALYVASCADFTGHGTGLRLRSRPVIPVATAD